MTATPALSAVWVNGVRADPSGLHVGALDRGWTLGDGLFETMRALDGRVFRLDQHLHRLQRSLEFFRIPAPPELRTWIEAAVAAAGGDDAAVRATVTRGPGPGLAPPADLHPTVVLTVGPRPAFPRRFYESGLSVRVAAGRRNEHAATTGHKVLGYAESVLALIDATAAGADDALFLDTAGHCSEATAANLFVVVGDTLVTPPTTCAALPGLTRAAVLELARARSVPVEVRVVTPEELTASPEAFLTSSLRGIVPLVRVGDRPLGRGAPGALTRSLTAAYTALVERECRSAAHSRKAR